MASQNEIREQITQRIVEALEKGTPPWRRPWRSDVANTGTPRNAVSGKPYRGINVLLLDLAGYDSCVWATFKQWDSISARVKKGEHATRIVYWRQVEKTTVADGGVEEIETFPLLRTYCVFNVAQVEGDVDKFRANHFGPNQQQVFVDYEPAERAIQATGAEFRFHGDRAFYSPSGDFIQMPPKESFESVHEFYATAFHELCHFSESRLKWKGSYALGELRAEMGAAFVAREVHVPKSEQMDNHHAYLASWIKELRNDHRAIFRVAKAAAEAADFILAFSRKDETPAEEEEAAVAGE